MLFKNIAYKSIKTAVVNLLLYGLYLLFLILNEMVLAIENVLKKSKKTEDCFFYQNGDLTYSLIVLNSNKPLSDKENIFTDNNRTLNFYKAKASDAANHPLIYLEGS